MTAASAVPVTKKSRGKQVATASVAVPVAKKAKVKHVNIPKVIFRARDDSQCVFISDLSNTFHYTLSSFRYMGRVTTVEI